MKTYDIETELLEKAAKDSITPKIGYRSPVIHTTCPPELLKRMKTCIDLSDMESQSQFVRVAIKRLVVEIEKRQEGIDKAVGEG